MAIFLSYDQFIVFQLYIFILIAAKYVDFFDFFMFIKHYFDEKNSKIYSH